MPSTTNNPGPKPRFGTSLRGSVLAAEPATTTALYPEDEDDILSDLGLHHRRRPVSATLDSTGANDDDSASDLASSTGSSRTSRGGRRRRRNRKNKEAGASGTKGGGGNISIAAPAAAVFNNGNFTGVKSSLEAPNPIPRMAETKPVRLQIGLNLDVELELKARLQGDVSLTLLAEKKPTDRPSLQVKPNADGVVDNELFFMRLGVLRLRQRWVDREVSPSLTRAVMAALVGGGFVAGFVCSRMLETVTRVVAIRMTG